MRVLSKFATTMLCAAALPTFTMAAPAESNLGKSLLKRAHDWHECLKIKITWKRYWIPSEALLDQQPGDPPRKIPDPLPPSIAKDLQCHPIPDHKFQDAHCGNVFEVTRQFCRQYCLKEIKVGDNQWDHTEYVDFDGDAMHAAYQNTNIDDFDLRISKMDHCYGWVFYDERSRWYDPMKPYDACMALMWGAWAQCNNKGRGGSSFAGCYNFTLTTLA